jgi:integrase
VPLSQGATDILKQVPRVKDCPWLFPAPRTTKKPLGSIKHAWQTARDLADLPGLRIHDLRHAAASNFAAANIDLLTIARVLGHTDLRSSARYAHVQNSTMLKAVEAGAATLNLNWSAAV